MGSGVGLAVPSEEVVIATSRRRPVTHDDVLALYREHHDGLLRLAVLVAPEDGMAEDIVQEAFVRLYRSWGGIVDTTKVAAYLRSTVINLARGRGRRISVALRKRPAASPDAASAEEGALRNDRHREVVRALRQLPDRQRACLVLRFYEDLTETQIAEVLGISVGSVRTHMHRGRAALAARLSADGGANR